MEEKFSKYRPIPQMNPMNWLLLFIYFNILMFITLSKMNFLYKEFGINVDNFISKDSINLNLKLKI